MRLLLVAVVELDDVVLVAIDAEVLDEDLPVTTGARRARCDDRVMGARRDESSAGREPRGERGYRAA